MPLLQRQGVWVIVLVVGVGLTAASWGWWVRYDASDAAMEYLTPAVARCILQAPEVRLRKLSPVRTGAGSGPRRDAPLTSGSIVAPDGRRYQVTDQYSLASWRGMSHLRHAFVQDSSYEWPPLTPEELGSEDWQWQIVFEDKAGKSQLWLRLSPNQGDFAILQADSASQPIDISPAAAGIREVLRAGLEQEERTGR